MVAGFQEVRLVNQTTAAVSEYCRQINRKKFGGTTGESHLLAVMCMGSRSIELSVFKQKPGRPFLKLLYTTGRADFGGENFTEALTKYCMEQWVATTDDSGAIWTELRVQCEQLKHDLSTTPLGCQAKCVIHISTRLPITSLRNFSEIEIYSFSQF